MTWARIKETGSGKLALRLVIEGMPTEWVTDSSLATTSTDDRVRKVGLELSCFRFAESADISSAENKGDGFTARITDIDFAATEEFAGRPGHTTWLTQDMTASDTTIHVLYNLGWVVGKTIHVGTECMTVATLPDSVSATVTRGRRNTIQQAHFTNDGENLRSPEVTTDRPTCIEGRRVYVYAYGDGETGNGTRIFAGVCATDASMRDGLTWEFTVDPLTSLLEQDIGADLEEKFAPRGIHYYSDNGLTISITRLNGASFSDAATSDRTTFNIASSAGVDGTVFFENQDEFCAAINAEIVTRTVGWSVPLTDDGAGSTPTLMAVPTDDGAWTFNYQTGSTAYWLVVEARSAVDPWFYTNAPNGYERAGVNPYTLTANRLYSLVPVQDSRVYSSVPGQGMVPRGVYGHPAGVHVASYTGSDLYRSLFIGGSVSVAGISFTNIGGLSIEWPEGSSSEGAVTTLYNILATDTADRSLRLQDLGTAAVQRVWTPELLPKLSISRSTASGTLYDYIEEICTNSADSANAGYSPLLTTDDVDLSESETAIESALAGVPFMRERVYAQSKRLKLSEVLGPELLLLGLVVCMDETGKLVVRKLRATTASGGIAATIDESNTLSGVRVPTWERFQSGSVNEITLKTGWDPKEDKYNGTTFRVRDVGSLSRNKLARKIDIEPKSFSPFSGRADTGLTYRDIMPAVEPILGLLGYPYDVITVPVPLSLYDVLIGDNVLVDSHILPNAQTGKRGMSGSVGIVIGREWNPSEAHGILTILISLLNLAGYAPTSRVASYTGTNPYTLNIAAGSQPTGYATVSSWAVGDVVRVYATNSVSPTVREGTISSINTGSETITLTLSGTIPAGTLDVDYHTATDVQESQEIYGFLGNDSGIVEYGSGDGSARLYAP